MVHPIRTLRHGPRRKKAAIIAVPLVLLLAGVAVALIFFKADVTGQSTVPAPVTLTWQSAVVHGTTGGATCTATISGGDLDVQLTGFPGSTCSIGGQIQSNGAAAVRVQDLVFNGSVDGTFPLDGAGCGVTWPQNGPSTQPIETIFTIRADAPTGTVAAGPDAGVVAVPVGDYVDSECPR